MWKTIIAALAAFLWLEASFSAHAMTEAEEKQLFTVTGVEVDVTGPDAAQAKLKAISEAQVKAFGLLAEKLAGESGAAIMTTLPPEEVGRLMASLSVESERTGPGRYIGKLTISFLPAKVRDAFLAKGVALSPDFAGAAPPVPAAPAAPAVPGPVLLIPVWIETGEPAVIWDQTPLRRALAGLDLAGGRVAFRLPLGDTEDWSAFATPAEANATTLAPLLSRYQTSQAVLLLADRDAMGISLSLVAIPEIPGLSYSKTFPPRLDGLTQAVAEITSAIASAVEQQAAALPVAPQPIVPGMIAGTLDALVALESPDQWPALRQNLLTAKGLRAVDLLQVAPTGVQVRLTHEGSVPDLQMALSSLGLDLLELSTGWEIRPR